MSSPLIEHPTSEANNGDLMYDEGEDVKMYLAHNQRVRNLVREQGKEKNFLEFNIKQGWQPLCDFFGKLVPEGIPFANVDDSAEHRKMIDDMRWLMPLGYLTNAMKGLLSPGARGSGGLVLA